MTEIDRTQITVFVVQLYINCRHQMLTWSYVFIEKKIYTVFIRTLYLVFACQYSSQKNVLRVAMIDFYVNIYLLFVYPIPLLSSHFILYMLLFFFSPQLLTESTRTLIVIYPSIYQREACITQTHQLLGYCSALVLLFCQLEFY